MTAALAQRECPVCGAVYEDPRLGFCRVDGAALSGSSRDPLIGTVIAGRYRVQEPLGEGGMGSVYVAEHLVMQRQVALKIVRPELADDPVIAKRFVREARIASRLRSPRIVQTLDCGVAEDGRLFLAMERLVGATLRARIAAGPVPVEEAARITSEVLEGLRVAHGAGVVHRDLKPDNVFICDDGTVKVLDFGIARIFESSTEQGPSLTATSAIIGTALYMSPEAVSRSAVEPPADVYALGAMFFEMLTGEPPFFDSEPVLLMGMHLRVPPPTLSSRTGRPWSLRLEALLAAMLDKEPEGRPTLDAISAELAASEAEGFASLPTAKPRPWGLIAAAAAVGAVGSIAMLTLALLALAPFQPAIVPRPRPQIIPASGDEIPEEHASEEEQAEAGPLADLSDESESAAEPAAEAVASIEIDAQLTPPSTVTRMDGELVDLPTTLPADGATHELVFSAQGHREERRMIVADASQHLIVALDPLPRRTGRRASPTRAPIAAPTVRPLPAPAASPRRLSNPLPRRTGGGMTSTYGL